MTLRHCLHIYLCRSTAVRFQDFGSHTPGPSLDAVGAVQALAWPKSCLYVTIKPTETRTRSIPVAGTLTALLDVLQTLDLGNHQWRCNSMVCGVARRVFSSSSQSHGPWVSAVASAPPLYLFLPPESAPEFGIAHDPIKQGSQ